MKCSICDHECRSDDARYRYLNKGLDSFNAHVLCGNCYKRLMKKHKIIFKEFNWGTRKQAQCKFCKKMKSPIEVHSFTKASGTFDGIDERWINFCDECAKEHFSGVIAIMNIRSG